MKLAHGQIASRDFPQKAAAKQFMIGVHDRYRVSGLHVFLLLSAHYSHPLPRRERVSSEQTEL